jgi:hypothetical protein
LPRAEASKKAVADFSTQIGPQRLQCHQLAKFYQLAVPLVLHGGNRLVFSDLSILGAPMVSPHSYRVKGIAPIAVKIHAKGPESPVGSYAQTRRISFMTEFEAIGYFGTSRLRERVSAQYRASAGSARLRS